MTCNNEPIIDCLVTDLSSPNGIASLTGSWSWKILKSWTSDGDVNEYVNVSCNPKSFNKTFIICFFSWISVLFPIVIDISGKVDGMLSKPYIRTTSSIKSAAIVISLR